MLLDHSQRFPTKGNKKGWTQDNKKELLYIGAGIPLSSQKPLFIRRNTLLASLGEDFGKKIVRLAVKE